MSVAPEVPPNLANTSKPRQQPRILELVPTPRFELFVVALREPNPLFEPVTSEELQTIRRQGDSEMSAHFLTTVLLRSVGDTTSIKDYGYHRLNLAYDKDLQTGHGSRRLTAESTTRVERAGKRAAPYIEMLGVVRQYRDKYRVVYGSSESAMERSEFITSIYERSDGLKHPAIDYIHSMVMSAEAMAVESERLLRIMLIDDANRRS